MRRWIPAVVVAAAGVYAGWTVSVWSTEVEATDALFDWVVVQAITGDGTPHDPLHELFRHHGYSAPVELHEHPRTPGALLLQTPMLAVGKEWARPILSVVSVASLAVLAWAASRLTQWPKSVIGAVGVVAAMSYPVREGFLFGSQSLLVAALIGVAWVWLREGRDMPAGVALAAATTLKLFPGLLVVLLWRKHRRASWWALGVTAALNLVGLLLPDVSVAGTIEAMRAAQEWNVTNPANIGLGLPVWATIGGACVAVLATHRSRLDSVMVVGSAAMLILVPFVWVHYLVVFYLPVVVAARRLLSHTREGQGRLPHTEVVERSSSSAGVL